MGKPTSPFCPPPPPPPLSIQFSLKVFLFLLHTHTHLSCQCHVWRRLFLRRGTLLHCVLVSDDQDHEYERNLYLLKAWKGASSASILPSFLPPPLLSLLFRLFKSATQPSLSCLSSFLLVNSKCLGIFPPPLFTVGRARLQREIRRKRRKMRCCGCCGCSTPRFSNRFVFCSIFQMRTEHHVRRSRFIVWVLGFWKSLNPTNQGLLKGFFSKIFFMINLKAICSIYLSCTVQPP